MAVQFKTFGTTMSEDIVGYRLSKAANLSSNKKHLIKATLNKLLTSFVKEKLKQTISDSRQTVAQNNEDFMKTEDAYLKLYFNPMSLIRLMLLNENHLDMQYNDSYNFL